MNSARPVPTKALCVSLQCLLQLLVTVLADTWLDLTHLQLKHYTAYHKNLPFWEKRTANNYNLTYKLEHNNNRTITYTVLISVEMPSWVSSWVFAVSTVDTDSEHLRTYPYQSDWISHSLCGWNTQLNRTAQLFWSPTSDSQTTVSEPLSYATVPMKCLHSQHEPDS
jgi:hypothetical protein